MEDLLQNFSHEHPLAFYEEGNDDGGDDEVHNCFGCSRSVRGSPTYTCPHQCNFFLHKSCAELPEKILSFLHSRHPLTLIVTNETWDCDGCHVTHDLGFAYNCSLCEFNLDVKCASLNNSVIHESQGGHNHSFMFLRPVPFTCDVCSEESNGESMSCLCTACQFHFCEACFPLRLTVKQIGHDHRLNFTSYIDPLVANSINYSCKICYRTVDNKFPFYYCADCNYITHIKCATSEGIMDDENPELILQPLTSLSSTLKHFSHQRHCLTLMNNDKAAIEESSDHHKICDGCVQQISSSLPFYSCGECNFFLHTSCAQLPNKILHPLHEHALFLFAEAASIFKCNACGTFCNGFVYMCERCNFFIEVKCSFYPDPFEHKGHHCHNVEGDDDQYYPLKLHPQVDYSKMCIACDLLLPGLYRCDKCTFKLDMRCAALPYTTKHRCPNPHNTRDLLELTYHSIDDGSDEYYCDMCEEKRDKDHWFYHCSDCDYSVHPECALEKYRIKFGKSYKIKSHPHPLTIIEQTKGNLSCWRLTNPWEELVLMCFECNFSVSLGEIREMRMRFDYEDDDDEEEKLFSGNFSPPRLNTSHLVRSPTYCSTHHQGQIQDFTLGGLEIRGFGDIASDFLLGGSFV